MPSGFLLALLSCNLCQWGIACTVYASVHFHYCHNLGSISMGLDPLSGKPACKPSFLSIGIPLRGNGLRGSRRVLCSAAARGYPDAQVTGKTTFCWSPLWDPATGRLGCGDHRLTSWCPGSSSPHAVPRLSTAVTNKTVANLFQDRLYVHVCVCYSNLGHKRGLMGHEEYGDPPLAPFSDLPPPHILSLELGLQTDETHRIQLIGSQRIQPYVV